MDKIKASEVFVTIVKQGSMIKAADYLGMSRAMVTRYLNEWRSGLGCVCCIEQPVSRV